MEMEITEEEIDVETTSDPPYCPTIQQPLNSSNPGRKRSYHNILERKRRNHIKDAYLNLRDVVPALSGRKVSRIYILKKSIEYIRNLRKKIAEREVDHRNLTETVETLRKVADFLKTKDCS